MLNNLKPKDLIHVGYCVGFGLFALLFLILSSIFLKWWVSLLGFTLLVIDAAVVLSNLDQTNYLTEEELEVREKAIALHTKEVENKRQELRIKKGYT